MTILKIFYRVLSLIKTAFWYLLYPTKFHCGHFTFFYPRTHLTIDGGELSIGHHCFFNRNCSINCLSNITIGNDCIFGENVCIYDHNHNFKGGPLIRKQGFIKKNVTIQDNCWIGSNVVILPGITIGKNSVIAAGSIVTKSIPKNTIFIQKRSAK